MWERDPTFPSIIVDALVRVRPRGDLGSVAKSLKSVLLDLKEWISKNFGNVLRDIEKLRAKLESLQLLNADRVKIRRK